VSAGASLGPMAAPFASARAYQGPHPAMIPPA
jgi:hypothetical protein